MEVENGGLRRSGLGLYVSAERHVQVCESRQIKHATTRKQTNSRGLIVIGAALTLGPIFLLRSSCAIPWTILPSSLSGVRDHESRQ